MKISVIEVQEVYEVEIQAMAPKEITLVDIYSTIVPFVIIMVIGVLLVMMFPQIALRLPETYYDK